MVGRNRMLGRNRGVYSEGTPSLVSGQVLLFLVCDLNVSQKSRVLPGSQPEEIRLIKY